jgi:cell pole-organizing protein PopZ
MLSGEDARMTQPAKSQEPSMEEILASIRRIIADDDASKSVQRVAEPPKPAPRPAPPPPRAQPEPEPESSVPEVEAKELSEPIASMPEPEDDQASDILDLTESMAAPEFHEAPVAPPAAAPMQFRKIEGFSDVSFDDAEQSKPAMPTLNPSSLHLRAENGLLSSATSAAVDSAFNTLAQTVLVQNARTLEDLVREMLRPMLKAWLDDNLPGMVERLVRAEIERVARGR